jgi:hypothetical protein
MATLFGMFPYNSSYPRLSRASTSLVARERKTWMAGTSPAMTTSIEAGCLRLIALPAGS